MTLALPLDHCKNMHGFLCLLHQNYQFYIFIILILCCTHGVPNALINELLYALVNNIPHVVKKNP